MDKIRVLVVEDSLTVRQRLVEVLGSDPGVEVAGQASDGKTGIELCRKLRPDVVTLDMALPVLSGLAAAEYIMAYCPTPILIVSASTNRGELFKTYDALAAGAVDVLEKPTGSDADGGWERLFLSRVKLVSRIKVVTHLRARLNHASAGLPREAPASNPAGGHAGEHRLVAIGSSTGGPAACLKILRALPPGFSLPVLLVIHIGQAFGGALAEWLDSQLPIPVTCAQDGESLPAAGQARVVMAPPDRHLILHRGRLRLTRDPERHSCRPSVDVLFESVAREMAPQSIGCLLTGMGKDGAAGLLALRQAGGRTLAQDEATSVVYGMPQEAVRLGAAEQVHPLDAIAPALAALAGGTAGSRI